MHTCTSLCPRARCAPAPVSARFSLSQTPSAPRPLAPRPVKIDPLPAWTAAIHVERLRTCTLSLTNVNGGQDSCRHMQSIPNQRHYVTKTEGGWSPVIAKSSDVSTKYGAFRSSSPYLTIQRAATDRHRSSSPP